MHMPLQHFTTTVNSVMGPCANQRNHQFAGVCYSTNSYYWYRLRAAPMCPIVPPTIPPVPAPFPLTLPAPKGPAPAARLPPLVSVFVSATPTGRCLSNEGKVRCCRASSSALSVAISVAWASAMSRSLRWFTKLRMRLGGSWMAVKGCVLATLVHSEISARHAGPGVVSSL